MIECKEGDHIIFMVDGKQKEGRVDEVVNMSELKMPSYLRISGTSVPLTQVIAKQEELFGEDK